MWVLLAPGAQLFSRTTGAGGVGVKGVSKPRTRASLGDCLVPSGRPYWEEKADDAYMDSKKGVKARKTDMENVRVWYKSPNTNGQVADKRTWGRANGGVTIAQKAADMKPFSSSRVKGRPPGMVAPFRGGGRVKRGCWWLLAGISSRIVTSSWRRPGRGWSRGRRAGPRLSNYVAKERHRVIKLSGSGRVPEGGHRSAGCAAAARLVRPNLEL